jgi:hypothetical protein
MNSIDEEMLRVTVDRVQREAVKCVKYVLGMVDYLISKIAHHHICSHQFVQKLFAPCPLMKQGI